MAQTAIATGPSPGSRTQAAAVRVPWVDVARGLCIALVVMMHATLGVGEAMDGEGWLHEVIAFARPFRIPAFFLLAGLMAGRVLGGDLRTFIDRRVLHFLYFYLLWTALQIGLKVAIPHGIDVAAAQFLHALVEPFGTLWFIYMLPVFFAVTRLLRPVPAPLVLAVAAALEMAHVRTGWLVIDEFSARFVWFFAGVWLAAHIAAWADMGRDLRLNMVAFIGGFALLNGYLVGKGQSDIAGTSLFLGALGILALIGLATLLVATRVGHVLAMLGRNSLVIYLGFFVPMVLVRSLLLQMNWADALGISLTGLLVWLSALTLPFLLAPVLRQAGLRFLFARPGWARLAEPPQPVHPPARVTEKPPRPVAAFWK